MKEETNILSPAELILTFVKNTNLHGVVFLDGHNPFTVRVNEEEWYVYIKNLSPAQLSNNNPDVWRIQLPQRDDFDEIKESAYPFLLLGYDASNDVYTTWNPYWCKQRLNVGKRVSLYSRLSLQQEVRKEGIIKSLQLNNEGVVVCMPATLLYDYIKNIKEYFPVETTFEARGSSIQKRTKMDAESIFKLFTNLGDCKGFMHYMQNLGKTEDSIRAYIRHLINIMDSGLIEKHKNIFLKHSRVSDYLNAVIEFKGLDDVAPLDAKSRGYIRTALNHYVRYLIELIDANSEDSDNGDLDDNIEIGPSFELDEYGKLTTLDDVIKEKLVPFIRDVDYPDYEEMINITNDYYPSEITKKMTIADWIDLFNNTKWSKTRCKKEDAQRSKGKTKKDKQGIRLILKNGVSIQMASATETYLYVFENFDLEQIIGIDFGYYVIDKTRMPDFANSVRYQVQLHNGWFVSTNFDTPKKVKILQRISEELGLGFKVEVV